MKTDITILAIDDDLDILYTLDQICRFQDWTALLAKDYSEARGYIAKGGIDLVLVDYHMPGVDGIAAVKEIRKTQPAVPIIVLTVEEREAIVQQFMQAGATDYSLKPIKAVDLISRINVHLRYQNRNQYYENHDKGISALTLKKIEAFLRKADAFTTVEEIAAGTQIKQKTVYRYLRHLDNEGRVDTELSYPGTGSGRPKTTYMLRR